jgi:hypothetical protein
MKKREIVKECILCSIDFSYKDTKRNSKRIFCSSYCAIKSNGMRNKGKKMSLETKKKISIKTTGENNPFYGKKHKKDTIELIKNKRIKSAKERIKYTGIPIDQISILEGILISDGSLNNPRNSFSTRLTLGFKYKETLERIIKDLNHIQFGKISVSKRIRLVNEITGYHCKSLSYGDLTEFKNRWYVNGIKRIDLSVKINPKFLYWWYICDGYMTKYGMCLCTESFTENDILSIIEKLKDYSIDSKMLKRKRILISRKSTIDIFRMIELERIEIQKEYLHKFEIKWEIKKEH